MDTENNILEAYRVGVKKASRKDEKTESPQRSRKSSKKGDDKNLKAIGKSTGEDCCACIRVLSEYIKEICKLICCVSHSDSPDTDTRFGQLFCELGDISMRLGQDVYNMLKFLLRCMGQFLSTK